MMSAAGARLIVNADDYGYFACVSRGILDSHRRGVVTATGVLPNGPDFEERAAWLREAPGLDVGVHLNLSYGRPVSAEMARALRPWGGSFQGKLGVLSALARGRLPLPAVEAEWEAQLERCLRAGLQVRFLNAHEHLHAFPAVAPLVEALARRHAISHVRRVQPEWRGRRGLLRNVLLGLVAGVAPPRAAAPRLLGVAVSGRLGLDYLRAVLPRLATGGLYELMCHPGHFDAGEVQDARLRRYHAWEAELDALTRPELRTLCAAHDVQLIGYRDLPDRGAEA
jgi:chitin disaccharide deacetylase